MKDLEYKENLEARGTLLRRIKDVAHSPSEATQDARSVHRRAERCTEAQGGHFQ
jgi:hypothetical protein